jgi:hypothetical protein
MSTDGPRPPADSPGTPAKSDNPAPKTGARTERRDLPRGAVQDGIKKAERPIGGTTDKAKPPAERSMNKERPPNDKLSLAKLRIDGNKYPESALHRMDSFGHDRHGRYSYSGKVDRPGAAARRKEQVSPLPVKQGHDRDEAREAVLDGGGKKSPVGYVGPSDNKGAGGSFGAQLNGRKDGYHKISDGRHVRVFVDPPTDPVKAAIARGRLLYGKHEAT